jgi:hypothetical protein
MRTPPTEGNFCDQHRDALMVPNTGNSNQHMDFVWTSVTDFIIS